MKLRQVACIKNGSISGKRTQMLAIPKATASTRNWLWPIDTALTIFRDRRSERASMKAGGKDLCHLQTV